MVNNSVNQFSPSRKGTKIIATLGPAVTGKLFTWEQFNDPSNSEAVKTAYQNAADILNNGVDVVRFNFSHGSYEEQSIRLKILRETAQQLHKNVGFLLDTKGPELRVGKFLNDDILKVTMGDIVTIYTTNYKPMNVTKKELYVYDSTMSYNMAKDITEGSKILIDDGKLCLIVTKIDVINGKISARAKNSWDVIANKRINLPGAEYNLPFLSEKDTQDIKFAIENNFDYIALSFVNCADNILSVRKLLDKNVLNNSIQIISKIETAQAIKNLDEIITHSDGVMVARGDLGLEIDFYDIPHWEKCIIDHCRKVGKFSIVATQMLDSLEHALFPTRAEVTDVFYAVEQGADATMLSGETANGNFPAQTVNTMALIDQASEGFFDYKNSLENIFPLTPFSSKNKAMATTIATACLPDQSDPHHPVFRYRYLFVRTDDTQFLKTISAIRVAAKIIAISFDDKLARTMAINYGIEMHIVDKNEQNNFNFEAYCKKIANQDGLHDCAIFSNDKIYSLL